jgi:hypothetical protein
MVAGVQAGRISAVVFISPVPSVGGSRIRLLHFEMGVAGSPFKNGWVGTGQVSVKPQAFLRCGQAGNAETRLLFGF